MRTKALLYFRLPLAALVARLPDNLRFLATAFQPYGPRITRANVDVTPPQVEAVIQWGRTRVGDSTVLRIARLDQRYDRQELGEGHVELFRDFQFEPPQVLNVTTAFEARWSCTNCNRVDMSQVGALEVDGINPDVDIQLTETYEVLLRSRLANIAARAGAIVRPLGGRQEFVQLMASPTVTLVPVFPLSPVDEACPGCGRITCDRSDYVEGGLFSEGDTALTVAQEWPLTLHAGLDVVGKSKERIGWRGVVSEEKRHVVGQQLDMVEEKAWVSGETVVVVRLTFVDALLGAGALIPSLRPVAMAGEKAAVQGGDNRSGE